jgi:hypothetical protein
MDARRPIGRALPAVAIAIAVAAGGAGCGGSRGPDRSDVRTPGRTPAPTPTRSATAGEPVSSAEATVIRGWSTSLRQGDVGRAARYFALPAVVANGTPPLRLSTRAEAEAFNRALPCGAKVVALQRGVHDYVVATFRLTERPGPGSCGTGTGALARTAFQVRRGHILQWLRVPNGDEAPGSSSSRAS